MSRKKAASVGAAAPGERPCTDGSKDRVGVYAGTMSFPGQAAALDIRP